MNCLLSVLIWIGISTTANCANSRPSLNLNHVESMTEASRTEAERKFIVKDGKKFLDRAGVKYGRLTALHVSHYNIRQQAYWMCRCDCGTEMPVFGGNLTSLAVKSCGCYSRDHPAHLIHGQSPNGSHTREYDTWISMRSRVLNPKNKRYKHYGERGITICSRWDDFRNFFADMGKRPRGLTLHRSDNDGNYCPENCVWATSETQARAKTNTRWVTCWGRTQSLADWADDCLLPYSTIHARLGAGWAPEKAFTEPVEDQGQYS